MRVQFAIRGDVKFAAREFDRRSMLKVENHVACAVWLAYGEWRIDTWISVSYVYDSLVPLINRIIVSEAGERDASHHFYAKQFS